MEVASIFFFSHNVFFFLNSIYYKVVQARTMIGWYVVKQDCDSLSQQCLTYENANTLRLDIKEKNGIRIHQTFSRTFFVFFFKICNGM